MPFWFISCKADMYSIMSCPQLYMVQFIFWRFCGININDLYETMKIKCFAIWHIFIKSQNKYRSDFFE